MKRIVIMGASSGIGMAMAKSYLERGERVGLASRKTEAFKELKAEYPELVEFESIDVNDSQAPEKLHELIGRMGGMELYIHVSGIGYENPNLVANREAEVITTNAAGFARMVATAYGYFRDHPTKGAQIAAVTSVAGTNGIGLLAAYSASKKCAQTYLIALEQLARQEKMKVDFTDLRPGWIDTPLLIKGQKYPFLMSLQQATPLILKAIERRRRVAVIGWKWKLTVALWRMLPNWLWIRFPYRN